MRFLRTAAPFAAIAVTSGVVLAGLTGCSSSEQDSTGDPAATLNVFAASSTRVLNDALNKAVAPTTLTYSNGGSSELVQQIKDGAPADLLITASTKTMDQAVSDGTVETPVTLATNVMVMVVPKGNPAGITSVTDITDETNFVLCDPHVPCGDVSEQIIKDKGLNVRADSLESQVADVLGKVTSGEADAGWVYSTDAAAAGDEVEVIRIEGAEKHTNKILGAVTTETTNHEASQKVLDTLAHDFDATWEEYGFTPAD